MPAYRRFEILSRTVNFEFNLRRRPLPKFCCALVLSVILLCSKGMYASERFEIRHVARTEGDNSDKRAVLGNFPHAFLKFTYIFQSCVVEVLTSIL